MKKLNVLFLSMLTLATITSCSNDDEKSASLVGNWEITQEGETLATLEAVENEGGCGPTIIQFSQGGTFSENGSEYYDSECNDYSDPGIWSKNDNTLTVKYNDNDETLSFEILELTNSTLKIKEVDEEGTWFTVLKRK